MSLKKMMPFVQNIEEPVWMNITVGPVMGKALGLKSGGSSFYLLADESIPYADKVNVPDSTKKKLREKKPDFRGVYCSAACDSIPDILADLQKYCDVTGKPGLTYLNGKEYNLQPKVNNAARLLNNGIEM